MNTDILIDAIGMIDEKNVREAKALPRRGIGFSMKRVAALAAAILLCFAAALPALAATEVEAAYELLYAISPEMAQRLKPVRQSCVSQGIRMEVVAADIYEDTAEIYIEMKDLTGNRIDGTTDLFDSYRIHDSYNSLSTCSFKGYNEETGAATFLVTIKNMDAEKIRGNKVTFSVSEFLSKKTESQGMISNVDLSAASRSPETRRGVNIRGGSLEHWSGENLFLKAGPAALSAPADGVSVTAVGYIGGTLRVQVHYENIRETDDHGEVWLKDTDGTVVECGASVAFWDDTHAGSYEEYIFEIPYDELEKYEVYGRFITCNVLTKGNWQVTFLMEDVQEQKAIYG